MKVARLTDIHLDVNVISLSEEELKELGYELTK